MNIDINKLSTLEQLSLFRQLLDTLDVNIITKHGSSKIDSTDTSYHSNNNVSIDVLKLT